MDVLVRDGKIVRIGPRDAVPAGVTLIDLGTRTLLPGLIDVHEHPVWYFNTQGRYHTRNDGDTPEESRQTIEVNLRAIVRSRKEQGADFIKVFASGSIRDGGQQTMSQGQLDAICGEAKALGLRTVVHAHSAAHSFSASIPLLPMHPGIAVSPKLQAEHDAQTARVYACTEFFNVIASLHVQQGLPNTWQMSSQALFATAAPAFTFGILLDEVVLPAQLASANARVREAAITCL